MKWIELHAYSHSFNTGIPILINADNITEIICYDPWNEENGSSIFMISEDSQIHVVETYDEIKEKILNLK